MFCFKILDASFDIYFNFQVQLHFKFIVLKCAVAEDREAEKQKLQSLMAFGKDASASTDTLELKPNQRQRRKDEENYMESEELFDHCK